MCHVDATASKNFPPSVAPAALLASLITTLTAIMS